MASDPMTQDSGSCALRRLSLRKCFRWGLALAVLAGAWGLYAADRRLCSGEPGVAYIPADASCLVAVDDFPGAWRGLGSLKELSGLRDACLDQTSELVLAVRKATGIRPTPARWRLWMGPRLAVARQASGQWGGCARPGLLLRAVCGLSDLAGSRPHDSVHQRGSVYYAWRDGFLLFSPSEAYVQAGLSSAPRVTEPCGPGHEVSLQLASPANQGVLQIGVGVGFPVHGWLQLPPTLPLRAAQVTPLTLADAWPGGPLVSLTTASWQDLRGCLQLASDALYRVYPLGGHYLAAVAQSLADGWRQDLLSPDWSVLPKEWSLALLDVDVTRALPVPDLALAMRCSEPVRGTHPLEALGRAGTPLPYEWEGHPGEMIALAGEDLTLCLSGAERDWLATTRQQAMARVIGKMEAGQARQADFVIGVQWAPLAKRVGEWAGQTADEGLLGLSSRGDIERIVKPWVDGMAQLGPLDLVGRRDGNRLIVDGTLAGTLAKGRQQ